MFKTWSPFFRFRRSVRVAVFVSQCRTVGGTAQSRSLLSHSQCLVTVNA